MTASLRFLQINNLPVYGSIEVWRDFVGDEFVFRLVTGSSGWLLTLDQGARIALAAKLVRTRQAEAQHRGLKAKPIKFHYVLDDHGSLLEFGLVSNDTISLQIGDGPTIELAGADGDTVIEGLILFADQITAMRRGPHGAPERFTGFTPWWRS